MTKDEIQSVALRDVQVADGFFSRYADLVREEVMPYQWEALNDRLPDMEPSHCIDNFRVAAGAIEGRHQGAIFQDTDLYKWIEAAAFCIQNGTGKEFEPLADSVIDLVARAQEPDGYLNTYIISSSRFRLPCV